MEESLEFILDLTCINFWRSSIKSIILSYLLQEPKHMQNLF